MNTVRIVNIVNTIGIVKIAGTTFSIIGASHKPARNPNITVGSAAIISIIGFIVFLRDGCMNWETQIAEKIEIGMAKNKA